MCKQDFRNFPWACLSLLLFGFCPFIVLYWPRDVTQGSFLQLQVLL